MANKSLQHSSLTDNIFYRSMLAGNDAYFPEFESDDFLEEVVLSSAASSVTFTGLGTYATAGYKNLQIRMVGKTTAYPGFYLIFNSDTGNNYALHRLTGNGTNTTSANITNHDTMIFINSLPDEAAATNEFGAAVADILDFSNIYKNTTVRVLAGCHYTDYPNIQLHSGLWNNTAAVTSIGILNAQSGNFVAGSRFSLYGSKA